MADQERAVSPRDATHERLMRAILRGVASSPLVLKGGTALLVGYGLDRFSEDLDFDSHQKANIVRLIERSIPPGVSLELLDTPKDTATVTRHRVRYSSATGPRSLKIDISYRSPPDPVDVRVFAGLRVASIGRIAHQKLLAAHDGDRPRSKVRDLYDLEFIGRRYPAALTDDLIERFCAFAADPDALASRYRADYEEDDLIPERVDLEDLVTRICCVADDLTGIATATRKRIDGIDSLKVQTDAAYTLWECATTEINRLVKAGGSANEVDWQCVNDEVIENGIGDNGLAAPAIISALVEYSPAAVTLRDRAQLSATIAHRQLSLMERFKAKVPPCKPPGG